MFKLVFFAEDFWAEQSWNHQLTSSSGIYQLLLGANGRPKPAGTIIKRPGYADVLDMIAEDPTTFYTKKDIVDDITGAVSGLFDTLLIVLVAFTAANNFC